jgi:hypothetical protein
MSGQALQAKVSMICCFWNNGSISSPCRKRFIDYNFIPLRLDYIGFHETKKEQFTNSFLKNVSWNRNFLWNHLPAVGTTGGILAGINGDLFEIISWEVKIFSDSVVVKNKIIDFVYRITTVYDSTHEEKKQEFISELHELFLHLEEPALVGGFLKNLLGPL